MGRMKRLHEAARRDDRQAPAPLVLSARRGAFTNVLFYEKTFESLFIQTGFSGQIKAGLSGVPPLPPPPPASGSSLTLIYSSLKSCLDRSVTVGCVQPSDSQGVNINPGLAFIRPGPADGSPPLFKGNGERRESAERRIVADYAAERLMTFKRVCPRPARASTALR